MAAPTAEAGVYCPAATAAAMGADAEIGVALSGRIRLPSGPYLRGLPRFFGTFIVTGPSASAPPTPAAAGPAASGCGGGPVAGGDTSTPLELPFSTVAGDWKLTVASGAAAAVTTGADAADAGAGAAAAIGAGACDGAALGSPDLASMHADAATNTRRPPLSTRH
jgi:hypothetical protein